MRQSVARMAFWVSVVIAIAAGAALQSSPALGAQTPERPFDSPFEGEPGPNTWFFLQAYGNTTFAYRFRNSTYIFGQGLHFGVDLAAPCGTPILAIGDGTVYSVDSWHGAAPHNLLINHANGYASFYGHLLARSRLAPGQQVKAGDVIGLVGDPDLTCSSRPHLHLEIRSLDHRRAYNPLSLIDLDWDRLALVGGSNVVFEQDMQAPRRWQGLYDQPEVLFGYPLLNIYDTPWPPAW